MRIISLSKRIGQRLMSRHIAAELRNELVQNNEPVQLDFSGIKWLSHTFADELIGTLHRNYGEEIFNSRFRLRNVSLEIRGVISASIQKSQDLSRETVNTKRAA
ncbi:STAS-like domain-containing protein [Bdellovibrionota bacterium FG-2]